MFRRFTLIPLLLAATALVATAAPAQNRTRERGSEAPPQMRQRDRIPESAFEARQQGRILPLPEIEARIRQQMGSADYLGPELDMFSGTYRLKFLRGDRLIWVDVDGRTGQIVRQSGR